MSSTDNTVAPQQSPQNPGGSVPVPPQNQGPPPPDARSIASSSMLPNLPKKGPSSNSLSTITACLGYNAFHSRTLAVSEYLPVFNFISLIISSVDRLMLNTYRFGQSNPDWHPLFSQIYYGIIFVVHILVVRRTASVISSSENDFLTWFEANYALSSLPIAGPLKHFFQVITTTSGHDSFYGNVYPSFPAINCPRANGFLFANWRDSVLPPVATWLHEILHIVRFSDAETNAGRTPVNWMIYRPFADHHRNGHVQYITGTPGFSDLQRLPANLMDTFVANVRNIGLPPHLNAAAGSTDADFTTIAQYLRLGTNGAQSSLWFGHLISVMQRHAQFMKDSTNLASISSVGIGACLPIIYIQPNDHITVAAGTINNVAAIAAIAAVAAAQGVAAQAAVPARPATRTSSRIIHFNISAISKFPQLTLLAEQLAVLACINVDFSLLTARGANLPVLPTAANLRSGPIWTSPDRKDYAIVNVHGQIQTYLAGVFHADQRMTR